MYEKLPAFRREVLDAFGKAGVRPIDGASATARLPQMRSEISESLSNVDVLASGSVLVHGFRTADLPRESARHRDVLARAVLEAVPLGIRGGIARSTLADANETRDWRIYQDFAFSLIRIARKLYAHDSFAVELDNTVYALDTTTIELSMSLFPWAHYGGSHAAVKLHTLLDLRGNIPSFLYISDAKTGELTVFDRLDASRRSSARRRTP